MSSELISHIVTILVSFGVSVTILRKGWQSRDVPVLLLGGAVGFDCLEWIFWTLCAFTPAWGTPLGEGFAIACRVGISAAVICLLFFTRRVFRPQSRVATGALWLLTGAMVVAFLGAGTLGDWGGWRNDHIWNWIELTSQVIGYGWTASESLIYYLSMRRRVEHGLADPVVTNRLLLWGVYAGMYCASQVGYGFVLALYEDLTTLDTFLGALTVVGQFTLALAFFPPAHYVRWLRARLPAPG